MVEWGMGKMPPQDKVDLYDALIASVPEIERKGKNNPYTSVNSYMFTLLDKDGVLGMRLPKEEQKKFAENYGTGPFIQYGATMRDYVTVPDELLQDTAKLKSYLQMSYEYTKSLPPKKK